MFSRVEMNSVTFKNNYASNDKTAGAPSPTLFRFDTTMISSTYTFLFTSLTIQNNYFTNGYGMVYLDIPQVTFSSCTIKGNGQLTDGTVGVIVLSLSNTYAVSFSSVSFTTNSISNGAVVYVESRSDTVLVSSTVNLLFSSCTFSGNIGASYTSSVYVGSNTWLDVSF